MKTCCVLETNKANITKPLSPYSIGRYYGNGVRGMTGHRKEHALARGKEGICGKVSLWAVKSCTRNGKTTTTSTGKTKKGLVGSADCNGEM